MSSADATLYLAFWVLVLVAPIIACGYVVLAFVRKWRPVSVRLFLSSTVCGALVCGLSYAAVAIFAAGRTEIMPQLGAALFAAGFSIGAMLLGVWLLLRRVLSNNLMQPTGRERPAAD